MRTRTIGSLEVTVVGVGCNNFGRQLDLEASRAVIEVALDAGVTLFDTADAYGNPKGSSELVIGEVLRPHRDQVVIATKFGRVLDDGSHGAKAAYVRSATEASLRRLQTDYIDLMQLHIPDPDTPIEETLGALGELIEEGKVREIGYSNAAASDIRAAGEAAARHGTPRFVSTQSEYSLLFRRETADVLAECERQSMKLLPFRPLYYGLLTGKYRPGEVPPTDTRVGAKGEGARARILSEENMALVAALTEFAEQRERSLLELAYGWLLGHVAVPSVIAGVSSPSQMASNLVAMEWELTVEEMADVEKILQSGK